MTYPFKGIDLLNRDRMWRDVICLNPDHATVQFQTNEIGTIKCPMCESIMVTVVKPVITIIQNKSDM